MNEFRYATICEPYGDAVRFNCEITGWRNDAGQWVLKDVQIGSMSVPWGDRRETVVLDGLSSPLKSEIWDWARKQSFGDRWEQAHDFRNRVRVGLPI